MASESKENILAAIPKRFSHDFDLERDGPPTPDNPAFWSGVEYILLLLAQEIKRAEIEVEPPYSVVLDIEREPWSWYMTGRLEKYA